jgi:AcrR family transcriptional regulator
MREQVTAAILDAAEEVLAARGLEGASTAAIAERAGVAVGTLYNYFPDRTALIESLFTVRRAEILPRLTDLAKATARLPADKRLRAYVTGLLAVFEDQRRFMELVIAVDQHDSIGKQPVLLVTVIDTLVELLRPAYGKRSEDYARAIVGSMKMLVRWRVQQGEPLLPDADLIADTFLHGMQRK